MYLIIDAAPARVLVAVGQKERIAVLKEWVAGNRLSQELLPALEKILARQPRPRAIFCVTGPGSFTGLRIAVATANALGYAWDIPVVPIEAFEIYEVAQKNLKPPYEVVLDNIKDLVYVKRVRRGQSQFAVEKIGEGKRPPFAKASGGRRQAKDKNEKIIGWVAKEKQKKIDEQLHGAKEISGQARAKLIAGIGTGRLQARGKFSQPIKPLYINPPHITPKRNFAF